MKIFLSYASEQSELAKEIALALRAENHTVFFDRSALAAGEAYNAKIREAIEDSQLLVFLISPYAVAAGRYTLTELDFAERKWPRPWGYVLSVMVTPTPKADMPPYLRAGTVLQLSGNVAATIAAEIHRIPKSGWLRIVQRYRAQLLVLLALAIVGAGTLWWYQQVQAERTALGRLFSEAKIQQDNGHYQDAWRLFEEARSLAPENPEVHENEAKLAMAWLDNARITVGKGSFSEIVDTVLPALSRCSVSPDKRHAADCFAHMGWGDFLKSREGQGGLKPEQFYRRALALDPENPYAHAMSGFHILESHGSLGEAKQHFERALATGKERPYVRRTQLAAFLNYRIGALEDEAIRVVNDMRLNSESLPPDERDYSVRWSKLWNVYNSRMLIATEQQSFLSALSPTDHLATFQWLFPEDTVPEDKRDLYRFFAGSFQELAGDHAGALTTFSSLQKSLGKETLGGRLSDKTTEAINRLSKLNRMSQKIMGLESLMGNVMTELLQHLLRAI
ncbi:MAG: TIR domain-containing protein [Chromatiales bacterium]